MADRRGDARPMVYALTREGAGWTLTRREFVAATAAALAAAAVGGCGGGGGGGPSRNAALAHSGSVLSLAATPYHAILASGGSESSVKLWRFDLRGYYETVGVGQSPVVSLSASEQNALLFAAAGEVDVLRLPAGESAGTVGRPSASLRCLAALPDGTGLCVAEGDTVRLLSLPGLNPVSEFSVHATVSALAAIRGRPQLATGDARGGIQMWSLPDGALLWENTEHTAPVAALAAAEDGSFVVCGAWDGMAETRSAADGTRIASLRGHAGRVLATAVTPDGNTAATAGEDGTVRLWALPSGAAAGLLRGHTGPVRCLSVRPDGRVLASGGDDGTIKLWSLPDGVHLCDLLDLAVSSSAAAGSTYLGQDGLGYPVTVPAGTPMPGGWTCRCHTVGGSLCMCHGDYCSCDGHGCSCDQVGCSCDYDGCSCDSDSCSCDYDGCSCDGYSCSCDSDVCSCDDDSCSCDYDYGCACDGYGCDCDGDCSCVGDYRAGRAARVRTLFRALRGPR